MPQTYEDEIYISQTKLAEEIIRELPDFCASFFTHLKGKSVRTRLQYAYDIKRFFSYLKTRPGFRDINMKSTRAAGILDKLTLKDIQEYLDTLEYYSSGAEIMRSSPSSRARKASSLRSFYKYFYKIGEIEHDMAQLIDVPDIPSHPVVALDAGQVQRLLEAVKSEEGLSEKERSRHDITFQRDFAIVMTLLGTGIRVSELVGMNLSDIDFEEASIIIRRKGGDLDEVFFPMETEVALRDYVNNGRNRLSPSPDNNAVFLSLQHTRITVRSVQLLVKKYSQRAGLNVRLTPHKLRSTYATNLYEETDDLYLVRDALHHANVQTTTKYTRMDRDHKREAASKSSSIFQPDM